MGHYSQSSVTAGWMAALHFLHLSAQASLPTDVPSPSLKWLSSPLALPPPCGGVVLGREAWTLSPGGWGSSLGSATDGQVTLGFVSVFVKDGPSWEGEPSPGALRTVPGSSWVAAVVAAPVLLPTPQHFPSRWRLWALCCGRRPSAPPAPVQCELRRASV